MRDELVGKRRPKLCAPDGLTSRPGAISTSAHIGLWAAAVTSIDASRPEEKILSVAPRDGIITVSTIEQIASLVSVQSIRADATKASIPARLAEHDVTGTTTRYTIGALPRANTVLASERLNDVVSGIPDDYVSAARADESLVLFGSDYRRLNSPTTCLCASR